MHNRKSVLKTAALLIIFFISLPVTAKDIEYMEIDISKISRYNEDRIAYQQLEYIVDPEQHQPQDTSVASLLIIRDRKMYLFKDGYDDHKIVQEKRIVQELQNIHIQDELWKRKIDNKPDFLIITDRRREIMKRITTKPEDNISDVYSNYYQKIRDTFIKEHIRVFHSIIINRSDSDVKIIKRPIPMRLGYEGETMYYTSVTAKSKGGVIYFAEDADGDGITETFSADLSDGFNWGYNSGPNIIFIYKNTQENIKAMIKDLVRDALEGTSEEENIISKQFTSLESDTMKLIEDLVRMDVQSREKMEEMEK
jgi:hypothetical protein